MRERMRLAGHRRLLAVWRRLPPWAQRLGIGALVARTPVGALAIIRDEGGRVLFVHQTYRRDVGWGMPGGWVKRGEEPARAAEREAREEVGLVVRAVRVLAAGRGEFGEVRIAFQCERLDGRLPAASAEVDRAEYFAAGEWPPLPGRLEAFVREAIEAADGKAESRGP